MKLERNVHIDSQIEKFTSRKKSAKLTATDDFKPSTRLDDRGQTDRDAIKRYLDPYLQSQNDIIVKNAKALVPRILAATVTLPIYSVFALHWSAMNIRYAQIAGVSPHQIMGSVLQTLPKVGFSPFTLVSFAKTTRQLLSQPPVQNFLAELRSILINESGHGHNLYQLCQKYAADKDETTKWLAVLFNDVGNGIAGNAVFGEYGQALINIRTLLRDSKMAMYPEEGMPQRNAPYHYYVTKYLTKLLKDSGRAPKAAALSTFCMNSEYEFLSCRGYGGLQTSAEDLYLGYRAVHDVMGGELKSPMRTSKQT